MDEQPFLIDRGSADDAVGLIAAYGSHAGAEAFARADLSRDRGNVVQFCRWRQIARFIDRLGDDTLGETLH